MSLYKTVGRHHRGGKKRRIDSVSSGTFRLGGVPGAGGRVRPIPGAAE